MSISVTNYAKTDDLVRLSTFSKMQSIIQSQAKRIKACRFQRVSRCLCILDFAADNTTASVLVCCIPLKVASTLLWSQNIEECPFTSMGRGVALVENAVL